MKTIKEFIQEREEVQKEEEIEITYPGGVYISVKLSEETELAVQEYQAKYLKGQKINEKLHCTLIYSKRPQVEEIQPGEYQAIGTFQEFNLFGPDEDTLVVEINSQDLLRRNEELTQEYKFISDYDEYKSHITLSYGIENIDLNSLPAMDFAFIFENEEVEPLDTNWAGNGEDGEEESGTLVGKAMAKVKTSDKEDDKDSDEKETSDKKEK
jgi:hypothetical protein